ncbi:unnamed protein product, partial [Scytosiphon promiscuus]
SLPAAPFRYRCCWRLSQADMYSYGIVLWELCTLRKPFAGMSSHEHARKVRTSQSCSSRRSPSNSSAISW